MSKQTLLHQKRGVCQQQLEVPFLEALAQGGFQVEELARLSLVLYGNYNSNFGLNLEITQFRAGCANSKGIYRDLLKNKRGVLVSKKISQTDFSFQYTC